MFCFRNKKRCTDGLRHPVLSQDYLIQIFYLSNFFITKLSNTLTNISDLILYIFIQPQPIDAMLKQCMGNFLVALEDPDLNVRRVALVAFNSAAHNKPMLIRDLLDAVLPHLYAETKIKVSEI